MFKLLPIVLIGILSLLQSNQVIAQGIFEVPKNVTYNTAEDYYKYDSVIVEAAKWLEFMDLDKETFKRKQVNQFVMNWLAGSPHVNIVINQKMSELIGNNKELFNIYLASYARHMIENKTRGTKFSATKAGILSIIKVYKKNIEIYKNKDLESLVAIKQDAILNEYIRKNLLD